MRHLLAAGLLAAAAAAPAAVPEPQPPQSGPLTRILRAWSRSRITPPVEPDPADAQRITAAQAKRERRRTRNLRRGEVDAALLSILFGVVAVLFGLANVGFALYALGDTYGYQRGYGLGREAGVDGGRRDACVATCVYDGHARGEWRIEPVRETGATGATTYPGRCVCLDEVRP